MKYFKQEMFVGVEIDRPNKHSVVQVFDFDDTITIKPEGFDNTGMSKDEFFTASRHFEPDRRVTELLKLTYAMGDHIAVATSRPPERMFETLAWLDENNIPVDQLLMSTGVVNSAIAKQAMLQKLQRDYYKVGMLIDASPYNCRGAELQGVQPICVSKNDKYWASTPEPVYPL